MILSTIEITNLVAALALLACIIGCAVVADKGIHRLLQAQGSFFDLDSLEAHPAIGFVWHALFGSLGFLFVLVVLWLLTLPFGGLSIRLP
jgi:hypothetical protein